MLELIYLALWSGVVMLSYYRIEAADPASHWLTHLATPTLLGVAAAHVISPLCGWVDRITWLDLSTVLALFAFLGACHGRRRLAVVSRDDGHPTRR